MSWQRCKKEFIRKVSVDEERIKSMVKMSENELDIIKDIPLSEKSASKLAKDYYEIIKELMVALLLCYGLKSSNHECLVSFLKENYSDKEYEIKIIHKLKNIRNRVSYDGYFVSEDYIEENKLEFKHIIDWLKEIIVSKMGRLD